MPWSEVMHKWGQQKLHSGSKVGPVVQDQKQAVAIMLSEKRKAESGKKEYQPRHPGALSKATKKVTGK